MRKETPWGTWDAIGVREVAAILEGLEAPWCIAGGYAIDAFVGRQTREHDDIDVALPREYQLAVQAHLQPGWELHYGGDPPGTLRPWPAGVPLRPDLHDVWARRDGRDAWRFQLMLNGSEGSMWVYRRDPRIRRELAEITLERQGVRFVAPEVQLLFKSKGLRQKDEADFEAALPLMDSLQRSWLRDALQTAAPDHPWIGRLTT